MVACITAKQMADIKAIARIRDPEYANELNFIKEKLELIILLTLKSHCKSNYRSYNEYLQWKC